VAVPLNDDAALQLVLQNEYARVYRLQLAPGASTRAHRYDHDAVCVFLTGGLWERFAPGAPSHAARSEHGQVDFLQAGLIRGMRNTGNAVQRALLVELLQPAPQRSESNQGERSLDLGHGHIEDVLLDNSRLKATEMQIAPMMESDEDAGGHPELLVWLADGELARGSQIMRGREGEVTWVGGGTGPLHNAGMEQAHVITLEFK